MKKHDHDNPDITAFFLGELEPAAAARTRGLIACSPEAHAEFERIKLAISALQAGAMVPQQSLTPRQREMVLAKGQKLARASKILPFKEGPGRKSTGTSLVFKFAAAACLTIGAFLIGRQMAFPPSAVTIAQKDTERSVPPPPQKVAPVVQTSIAENNIVPERKPDIESPPANEAEAAPLPAPPIVARVEDQAKTLPQPPATPSRAASHSLKSFVITASQPEAVINLRPDLVRPSKIGQTEFAGVVLAAPMIQSLKPSANALVSPRKAEPQPSLVIHSLKADIATCPWDGARLLMRCVIRVPVDQAAIDSNQNEYSLAVKFDPARVRAYRLIMDKHAPPGGTSILGTRAAWYELIPVSANTATLEKPTSLGVIKMVQPRGSKDSQTLSLLDRGLSWTEASDDFAFETAVTGFNLLRQGASNIGALNYKLVLDLAEQSKSEDLHGDRARFIEMVEKAQKAASF